MTDPAADLTGPAADGADTEGAGASSDRSRAGAVALLAGLAALGILAGLSWLAIVGALAFTIFMHELGHFLTARCTGMKVTEFFLGFGPRLWSFRRGETEYGVKAIWAGAYVRITGMNNLDEVAPADEPRSFRRQSYPRKMLVLLAGSGMHFAMALVLVFALLAFDGLSTGRSARAERSDWTVATVSQHSAAASAGLLPGDELVSLDGVPRGTFEGFGRHVSTELKGRRVTVVFKRDGVERTVEVTIGERLTAAGAAGIQGLFTGDRILSVEGLTSDGPPSYSQIAAHAREWPGQPFDIIVIDPTTSEPILVKDARVVGVVDEAAATGGFFGVSAHYGRQGLGVAGAAAQTLPVFGGIVRDVLWAFPAVLTDGIADAFSWAVGADSQGNGAAAPADGRGYARQSGASNTDENRILSIYGVARIGAEAASDGVVNVMVLMLFVNVFIGVFNLLPLPPLDGGHAAVATYERLRSIGGREYRVDAARLLPFTYTVVLLLIVVGGVALMRDILDPVGLG